MKKRKLAVGFVVNPSVGCGGGGEHMLNQLRVGQYRRVNAKNKNMEDRHSPTLLSSLTADSWLGI